jgi:hypothetical protein
MKTKSQSNHDQMIRDVCNHLISHGYRDIKADLKGLPHPALILWKTTGKGHIPDVTAKSNGTDSLFEIETEDSIFDQHTKDQWTLFAANAEQFGKVFYVVVPKGSENSAESRLGQLGIEAKVWTVG